MAKSRFWEDSRKIDRLIDLWGQGITVDEIASDLGTTRGSIVSKRKRLLLPERGHNWIATPEKIAIAKNLRSIGLSYNYIGKRLGVTTRTVVLWVAKEVEEQTV